MALADSLEEQTVLEEILEASKPPLPPAAAPGADYLLTTPFRYTSPYDSRFRRGLDPGVWYGAEDVDTACAEVGYWRWRFIMDSDGLRDGEVRAELTLFEARVAGRHINLDEAPWSDNASVWTSHDDYRECQALATAAQASGVVWIRYRSARWPGGLCAAVFTPAALQRPHPDRMQTWLCRISATAVHFTRDDKWLTFEPGPRRMAAPAPRMGP